MLTVLALLLACVHRYPFASASAQAIEVGDEQHDEQFVFVGRWEDVDALSIFKFDPRSGELSPRGTESIAGGQLEALLVIDDLLVAASNPCDYRDPVSKICVNEHSGPMVCSISTLRLSHGPLSGDQPQMTTVSQQWSGGLGPTALALSPTRELIGVANYQSGYGSTLPLAPDGALGPSEASTRRMNKTTSLAHFVTFDDTCPEPRDAAMLVVDAGALEFGSFDPRSGAPTSPSVSTGIRVRHVLIRPERGILYALYELDGSVGVWPWRGANSDRDDTDVDASASADAFMRGQRQQRWCGAVGAAEIRRAPSAFAAGQCAAVPADEWQPYCTNARGENVTRGFPTEMVLNQKGDRLYVTNAMTPPYEAGEAHANGTVAVYDVARGDALRLAQVFAVPPGARGLALAPRGDFLITDDPDTGTVASLRLDPSSGLILGVASIAEGVPNAAAIAVWPRQRASSSLTATVMTTKTTATAEETPPLVAPPCGGLPIRPVCDWLARSVSRLRGSLGI